MLCCVVLSLHPVVTCQLTGTRRRCITPKCARLRKDQREEDRHMNSFSKIRFSRPPSCTSSTISSEAPRLTCSVSRTTIPRRQRSKLYVESLELHIDILCAELRELQGHCATDDDLRELNGRVLDRTALKGIIAALSEDVRKTQMDFYILQQKSLRSQTALGTITGNKLDTLCGDRSPDLLIDDFSGSNVSEKKYQVAIQLGNEPGIPQWSVLMVLHYDCAQILIETMKVQICSTGIQSRDSQHRNSLQQSDTIRT
ncbi:hypothetical protein CVT26_009866 [Gymnopilus dilepis]|uniref:Uncharacterized protein n=1 Tax=Gymnopilus dilepis TaxID=231916 RepID=A0A409YC50_9AGAR|nr:hypothetical protein CVT26_009866 [Gymnopilus dilepis]